MPTPAARRTDADLPRQLSVRDDFAAGVLACRAQRAHVRNVLRRGTETARIECGHPWTGRTALGLAATVAMVTLLLARLQCGFRQMPERWEQLRVMGPGFISLFIAVGVLLFASVVGTGLAIAFHGGGRWAMLWRRQFVRAFEFRRTGFAIVWSNGTRSEHLWEEVVGFDPGGTFMLRGEPPRAIAFEPIRDGPWRYWQRALRERLSPNWLAAVSVLWAAMLRRAFRFGLGVALAGAVRLLWIRAALDPAVANWGGQVVAVGVAVMMGAVGGAWGALDHPCPRRWPGARWFNRRARAVLRAARDRSASDDAA